MSSRRSQAEIQCPIGVFDAREVRIEALTEMINAAPIASDKVPYARELIGEAGVLLACTSHDAANTNCGLCRGFSTLRQQTANLIVKAGALGPETKRQFAHRNPS